MNERVEGIRPEELDGMLPLRHVDKGGICRNLEAHRAKGVVQFMKALVSAIVSQMMKLGNGVCIMGDFENIVIEGIGVLDGGCISVILVMKRGE